MSGNLRWRRWSLGLLGAAAAWGCSHGQHRAAAPKLDDAALVHLNETQMAPVDRARVEQGRARDGLARAKAREEESKSRVELAKSEREVAKAQFDRAKAERDLLNQQHAASGQRSLAEDGLRLAQDRMRATELKIDYLNHMVAVSHAETELALRHSESVDAELERAKFQSLRAAQSPYVEGQDPGRFDREVAEAESRESEARAHAAGLRNDAVSSYNRWQEIDARVRTASVPEPVSTPSPADPSK